MNEDPNGNTHSWRTNHNREFQTRRSFFSDDDDDISTSQNSRTSIDGSDGIVDILLDDMAVDGTENESSYEEQIEQRIRMERIRYESFRQSMQSSATYPPTNEARRTNDPIVANIPHTNQPLMNVDRELDNFRFEDDRPMNQQRNGRNRIPYRRQPSPDDHKRMKRYIAYGAIVVLTLLCVFFVPSLIPSVMYRVLRGRRRRRLFSVRLRYEAFHECSSFEGTLDCGNQESGYIWIEGYDKNRKGFISPPIELQTEKGLNDLPKFFMVAYQEEISDLKEVFRSVGEKEVKRKGRCLGRCETTDQSKEGHVMSLVIENVDAVSMMQCMTLLASDCNGNVVDAKYERDE